MSEKLNKRLLLLTSFGLIMMGLWSYIMIQIGKLLPIFAIGNESPFIVNLIQFFNGMIIFLGLLSLVTLILTLVWIIINLFRK